VVGDYCFLAIYWNVFEIYDLSRLSNPVMIGSYYTPNHGRELTVIDSLVFFGTDTELLVFDVSDYVSVGKTVESGIPVTFELLPPHPNPFNASTASSYKLQAT